MPRPRGKALKLETTCKGSDGAGKLEDECAGAPDISPPPVPFSLLRVPAPLVSDPRVGIDVSTLGEWFVSCGSHPWCDFGVDGRVRQSSQAWKLVHDLLKPPQQQGVGGAAILTERFACDGVTPGQRLDRLGQCPPLIPGAFRLDRDHACLEHARGQKKEAREYRAGDHLAGEVDALVRGQRAH